MAFTLEQSNAAGLAEEQRVAAANAAMKAGNTTEVEKQFPGFTLYQGVLTDKTKIPALQAEGATNVGGNLQGAPASIPEGSPGAKLQEALKVNPNLNPTQQYDASLKGSPIAGTTPVSPNAPIPSSYEQGFNNANQEVGDGAGDVSSSQAAGLIKNNVSTKPTDLGSVFSDTDEFMNSLVTMAQDYFNPANQRKSLTETYNQMLKDSGIQGIDTELLNMKNVIEGSEDDIRNEVTKAGGFATDSQVLALTNARNKQLIKNYNTLLETRNSKEKYLQTAIGLEQADRAAADQRFESMFNMGVQLQQMQQQMKTNAIAGIERMVNTIGWDGILDATQGDSHAQSLIEKTYGLPSGGMKQAAEQAAAEQARALQMEDLNIRVKESQLLTDEYQRRKIINDINTSGGGSYDAAQILAYAQQYASTGTIPTGIPKGSFGILSQVAKELPKSPGQILDKATGVTPDKLGAAGDAYGALYSAVQLAGQLKELDADRWGGVLAGTAGKLFGSKSQQEYVDLRAQIVDLLSRARSGAALTPFETKTYEGMLPSRFSNPLGFGADTDVRIDNFINALTSDLTSKTDSKGWVVNGITPVTIGDTVYKVGDMIENEAGQIGRINADGSITLIQ